MRRAVPGLLFPLLLVACSAPTKENEATQQVLVNAHAARDAVSQLTQRYGEILDPAAGSPDPSTGDWGTVTAFRESAEGLAVRQFLSEYAQPMTVDPAFARSREIEELSLATVGLVNRALEPGGTWGAFVDEMNGLRSRLDKALSTLETGTKSFILVQARSKTEEKAVAYSRMLAKVRAEAAGPGKGEGEAKTP